MFASIRCAVTAFTISARRKMFTAPSHVTSCNSYSYLFMLDFAAYFTLYHVLFFGGFMFAVCISVGRSFNYLECVQCTHIKLFKALVCRLFLKNGKMFTFLNSANKLSKKKQQANVSPLSSNFFRVQFLFVCSSVCFHSPFHPFAFSVFMQYLCSFHAAFCSECEMQIFFREILRKNISLDCAPRDLIC